MQCCVFCRVENFDATDYADLGSLVCDFTDDEISIMSESVSN